MGRDLLPPVALALIVILLPSTVETIIMPLIVHLFIFAYFDLIRLYPNQYLKMLTVNHFSKIIFLAEFGVWYSFFKVFVDYFRSTGDLVRELIRARVEVIINLVLGNYLASHGLVLSSYYVQEFLFTFLMLLFAFVFSAIAARRIKKYATKNIIPKIAASMNSRK